MRSPGEELTMDHFALAQLIVRCDIGRAFTGILSKETSAGRQRPAFFHCGAVHREVMNMQLLPWLIFKARKLCRRTLQRSAIKFMGTAKARELLENPSVRPDKRGVNK